ncbi:dienelactone hydrolase family protein [Mangrovimicrobium sediminis]|uniref:Dienelactone hydrolase family protein n=1 Tax=Mangrovimicrobium sediminis TaxID=2562682 RepID=A0A4Z0M1C7_9GAMM|nr:dienelactone hydrolase family protein [Haliea sp. SAOS-164]TGD73412.1 dienelactone hydrolase family protein [Haliea sp. SAOS-164]
MTIQTRLIEYTHGDTTLEGYLAWDDALAGPRPAVAISHAWSGRSEFECEKARKLAELGYVGFAIDMFGKGVQGTSVEENQALIQPFLDDRAMLQARIKLAVEVLREQPEVDAGKVAAMGFCFGGLCVLDLARCGADVSGVISFHGLFYAPGNTEGTQISAKVLVLHGYDDPMATPEQMVGLATELSGAGADWQIHAYGGTLHAFTNPEANDPDFGTVYSASADQRAWQSMQNFFAEVFA